MKKAVKRFYSPMSKRAEKAMRENRNFGTPVVDYLKICCKDKEKDYPSLSPLKKIDKGERYDIYGLGLSLLRVTGLQYRYTFIVNDLYEENRTLELGRFYFSAYNGTLRGYAWLLVSNVVLYDEELLHRIIGLPDSLGIEFNNFSRLDIAMDFPFNVSTEINRLLKNDELTLILKGRDYDGKSGMSEELDGVLDISGRTRKRRMKGTIAIHEANNKCGKGKSLRVYDKRKCEAESKEPKEYILDRYCGAKCLYRLELSFKYDAIEDYFSSVRSSQNTDILFKKDKLEHMFLTMLRKLIRFRYKQRSYLNWKKILHLDIKRSQ